MRRILIENRNFHCNRQSWVSVTWPTDCMSNAPFSAFVRYVRISLDVFIDILISSLVHFVGGLLSNHHGSTISFIWYIYMIMTVGHIIFVRCFRFDGTWNALACPQTAEERKEWKEHKMDNYTHLIWSMVCIPDFNWTIKSIERPFHSTLSSRAQPILCTLTQISIYEISRRKKKLNEIHGSPSRLRLRRYLYWNRCINCLVIFPNVIL